MILGRLRDPVLIKGGVEVYPRIKPVMKLKAKYLLMLLVQHLHLDHCWWMV
jgi:hypothetical protein